MDRNGTLWGVENGADRLEREDLGGDIHNDNPAEEVNKLNKPGKFYGYPYCFTEFDLGEYGLGKGTQWAWPGFFSDYDDDWCRNISNNEPPSIAMQAHSAPLGMTFFDHENSSSCPGSFPPDFDGQAFVGFHGSWNREIPTGFKVVRLENASTVDFLRHAGDDAKWPSGFRPVDVHFDLCGRLLVSSDGTRYDNGDYSEGLVLRICYGDCGGANYSATWTNKKKDDANDWYETTVFHGMAIAFGSVAVLFSFFYFLLLFIKKQQQQQHGKNTEMTTTTTSAATAGEANKEKNATQLVEEEKTTSSS